MTTAVDTLTLRSPVLASFFIPVVESLVGGYVVTTLLYIVLTLLITRLGRKVLMDDDCVSNTYTLLLCGTWLAASLAGAYICCGLAPFAPYGPKAFPVLLALIMAAVVFRNVQQLPGQQTGFANVAVLATIALGTFGGMFLRHAV